jgi:hypothetical protein
VVLTERKKKEEKWKRTPGSKNYGRKRRKTKGIMKGK